MKKFLVICGPTAAGKTQQALRLASEFNGSLVSCDSRQIYTGMDIGTGKDLNHAWKKEDSRSIEVTFRRQQYFPFPYTYQGIDVWLYDLILPNESFSVSQYVTCARAVIAHIHQQNKLPIIVGGSGYYLEALLHGIETLEIPPNEALRKILEEKTVDDLQRRLKEQRPDIFEAMNHSDQGNPRRLIRKLELLSQEPKKEKSSHGVYPPLGEVLCIGLRKEKEELQNNIAKRVVQRMNSGSLEELHALRAKGYAWDSPGMNTIGYREWHEYIANPSEKTKQAAISLWKTHEFQYAKRQMTWFRKQPNIHWIDGLDNDQVYKKMKERIRVWYT